MRISSRPTLAAAFCAALTFAAVAPCVAQADKLYTASHNQLEVVKIVLAQEAAWNRGDLDAFLSRFKDAPDTQAILGASARGLTTIRNAYRTNYPSRDVMGTIEYTGVEARELGEKFCLATGMYHLERSKKSGGSADGTFTEILEKTPEGWRIIFSETS